MIKNGFQKNRAIQLQIIFIFKRKIFKWMNLRRNKFFFNFSKATSIFNQKFRLEIKIQMNRKKNPKFFTNQTFKFILGNFRILPRKTFRFKPKKSFFWKECTQNQSLSGWFQFQIKSQLFKKKFPHALGRVSKRKTFFKITFFKSINFSLFFYLVYLPKR